MKALLRCFVLLRLTGSRGSRHESSKMLPEIFPQPGKILLPLLELFAGIQTATKTIKVCILPPLCTYLVPQQAAYCVFSNFGRNFYARPQWFKAVMRYFASNL